MRLLLRNLVFLSIASYYSFAQTPWVYKYIVNGGDINSCQFINKDIGYAVGYSGAVGYGIIIKTENGGSNWVSQNTDKMIDFRSISVIDENTAFIVGSDPFSAGTKIFKTNDGGKNWVQSAFYYAKGFEKIIFLNKTLGYAVGNDLSVGARIIRTSDGGLTWSFCDPGAGDMLLSLCNSPDGVIFAVGTKGWIIKSTDFGDTWISQNSGTEESLESVFFVNKETGFISLNNFGYKECFYLKTTDGGTTWVRTATGTNVWIRCFYFLDENIGFAVGDSDVHEGAIIKTIDGGQTWKKLESGNCGYLNTVNFIDKDYGFIAGEHGLILKTITGGG